jgi:hypothetical protein
MADSRARRHFLQGMLFAGGALALGAGALGRRSKKARGPFVAADDLFAELRTGTCIERWTIVAVCERTGGIIPVVMAGADGETFQVDIARRDPNGARGVAETKTLALYLSNGGRGDTATVEEHGLGVMALAARLARREAQGAVAPELLTLDERTRRHPDGVFRMRG